MSMQSPIAYLRRGAGEWNRWREENPTVLPDLRAADLSGLRLERAQLTDAVLTGANLTRAVLRQASTLR